jgi:hypothetical protein
MNPVVKFRIVAMGTMNMKKIFTVINVNKNFVWS